jgi:hypothetical protein
MHVNKHVAYRNGNTCQRVQQPHASPEVKRFGGIKQKDNTYTNEYDRVVQVHMLSTDLGEVQVHKQAEEKEAPTRKLFMSTIYPKPGWGYLPQQVVSNRENGGYHIRK